MGTTRKDLELTLHRGAGLAFDSAIAIRAARRVLPSAHPARPWLAQALDRYDDMAEAMQKALSATAPLPDVVDVQSEDDSQIRGQLEIYDLN